MSKKKLIRAFIPDIDNYWDLDKNEGLTPDDIGASASQKVWTRCPECGNSVLRAMRNSWAEDGNGGGYIIKCRTCGKRNDKNTLISCCPDILKYWDYDKNIQKPEYYTVSSGKQIHMSCPMCSKPLHRPVCDSVRKNDDGTYHVAVCLECSLSTEYRRTKDNRENTLDKVCPDIEKYWVYEQNTYRPSELTVYAIEEISLRCPVCGDVIKRLCGNSVKPDGDRFSIIPCHKCGINTHVKMKAKQRSISTEYPDIVLWWDKDNNDLSYDEVSHRSKYTASLRCPECGKTFERTLRSFITVHSDGSYLPVGCPHCGYTPRENPEENLLKVCPEIVEWWDYEKNSPHLPEEYTIGSQQTAYLKCPDCGMELYTGIHSLVETLDDGAVVIRHKGKCQKFKNIESENNIVARYPEIKLWWDYEKNPNPPEEYTLFSPQQAYFKCPECGSGSFRRITDAFALNKDGVPVIFNCPYCADIKIMPGVNDLVTTDPELAKEYSPNNERPATSVRKCLHQTALWICPECNGEYRYIISDRQLGDDVCPYCAGKKVLKGFNTLDIIKPDLAKKLSPLNLRSADEILPSNVGIQTWRCNTCGGDYPATILEMENGYKCPYCDNRQLLKGFNSLDVVNPELAKRISPLNSKTADEIFPSKRTYYIWRCPDCGGDYTANIPLMENGYTCPYCNGRQVLKGFNSLADVNPELAKLVSPLNLKGADEILPSKATPQVWRCPDCGGDYNATILEMENGYTCPYCDNRQVLKGFNSFGDRHPELLPELYELGNAGLGRSPFDMLGTSSVKLWWVCPKDERHKYFMSPKTRLMFQKRDREPCLYCRGQRRKKNHFINYYGNKKNNDIDT